MLASEFIKEVHQQYKGKTKFPSWGSDKAIEYLMVGNRHLRDYARETDNPWDSQFEEREIGTAGEELSYELDDDVLGIADDYVIIRKEDGREIKYDRIKISERRGYYRGVYISGRPKTLTFTEEIPADFQGGTIIAGLTVLPDALVRQSDAVPVDDPDWLVLQTAATLCLNDPAKNYKYEDLLGMANEKYRKMQAGQEDDVSSVPVDMPAVGETW